jgi:hypothetical protein
MRRGFVFSCPKVQNPSRRLPGWDVSAYSAAAMEATTQAGRLRYQERLGGNSRRHDSDFELEAEPDHNSESDLSSADRIMISQYSHTYG